MLRILPPSLPLPAALTGAMLGWRPAAAGSAASRGASSSGAWPRCSAPPRPAAPPPSRCCCWRWRRSWGLALQESLHASQRGTPSMFSPASRDWGGIPPRGRLGQGRRNGLLRGAPPVATSRGTSGGRLRGPPGRSREGGRRAVR